MKWLIWFVGVDDVNNSVDDVIISIDDIIISLQAYKKGGKAKRVIMPCGFSAVENVLGKLKDDAVKLAQDLGRWLTQHRTLESL